MNIKMEYRKAKQADYKALVELYDAVIDQQAFDRYSPKWTKGIYPGNDDVQTHLTNSDFRIVTVNDDLAAVAALVYGEEEMYRAGNWLNKTSDDKVAVIHLLAVAPAYRGKGVSSFLLEELIKEAADKAEVIHLDVMIGNLAAEKLYQKHGFTFAGSLEVFYEDTGRVTVNLYERRLAE